MAELTPYQRDLLAKMGIDVSKGDDHTVLAAQTLYGMNVRVVDGPPGTLYLVNEDRRTVLKRALGRVRSMGPFTYTKPPSRCGCECVCHEDENRWEWPGPCLACCDPYFTTYQCKCTEALRDLLKGE